MLNPRCLIYSKLLFKSNGSKKVKNVQIAIASYIDSYIVNCFVEMVTDS